ncbi:hypothetical protein L873DRAFT_1662358 [Choiromyces venosus 120613-1]|uniref:DUF1770-domain-containing protein n=1 Tax=Choiromyces venosus 120613-1 TaxID=1336337 RepID=A0A3N4KB53_9PEZI|nr:hypothetical protein L873DRAFT_1662358 [Choiromyces venosus 120613-1]
MPSTPSTAPASTSFDTLLSPSSSLSTTPTASDYSTTFLQPSHQLHHHRRPLPPLPDLRFEQSYLNSIAAAQGVWWKILLITVKDQVLLPLVQGLGYNLLLIGWRGWNSRAKWGGRGVGVRFRRWWWGVNDWEISEEGSGC